ncbi:MAG: DUF21 domain-containing protein [Lentisphaeria bacterium]|nr:DUF21 domain-containing protein [Lentisphaeria bacterium]
MIILILSMAGAMTISCLCSLLEAALLSLTPSQLAHIRQKSPRRGSICATLKRDIGNPVAAILICNTAAHTIGAAVAGAQFDKLFGASWMWLFSLCFTLLMVQYTEILPKTLGIRFNQSVMLVAAHPLQITIRLLLPLIRLTHFINRPFESRQERRHPSAAEEISALAALARSTRQISTRQERIINAVPQLSTRTAEQIMLPVENISFMSDERTLSDAINLTGNDFHTRYPVCDGGDPDKIMGYVNFKEVVSTYRHNPERGRLSDILRPIAFVAPEEPAAKLLEDFVTRHCHMAIVRSKNGRTMGLVTLEDIIEELLGDLDDEFDPLPRTFYSPAPGVWIAGGGLPLTMLARETGLPLPQRTEPVAVWFGRLLGRHPRIGDVYRADRAEFYVRKIRRGQVLEFTLKRTD